MTKIDVHIESGGAGVSEGTAELPVWVGLSYPLSLQYQATVGDKGEDGKRPVSLQVFLGSLPLAQRHDLGTIRLIPNHTNLVTHTPEPITYSSQEQLGFFANQIEQTLQLKLCEDQNGPTSLHIRGNVTLNWTIGAVDMELLDPPVVVL